MCVISVSDEGEFGLIGRITARLSPTPELLLGPGDDAAVIAAPDGRVVASTDLMIEGRHFRRDWSSAYDIGRKAAAANLADIVAMGARPTALLVGLGMPGDVAVEWVEALADGFRDEAAVVGAAIAGGDVVASETVVIAVTALGDLCGRPAVTRSGARPGDVVVLLGRPGRAAAGLALLLAARGEHALAAAHRRPEPPYDAALALATAGGVTAMLDVSDGLVADLGHLASASEVRVELDAAAVPIDAELAVAATLLGVDPFDWVAGGGDDHCFVATLSRETAIPIEGEVVVVGTVAALAAGETAGVRVLGRAAPARGGHEHFRS